MFCSLLVGNILSIFRKRLELSSHIFFFLFFVDALASLLSLFLLRLPLPTPETTVLSTFCQRTKYRCRNLLFSLFFFFLCACVCDFGPNSASACRGQTPFRSHNPATPKPWIHLLGACLYLFGMAVKASQNFRCSREFPSRGLCDRR